MSMNLTHLLAFHRVAQAGSFTLAARIHGVSQPTLSAQVRALEQHAGVTLFERFGRRIRLTHAGETLLAATTKLADAIDEAGAVLSVNRLPARGRLRVSADSAIHVIPVLAELKRLAPGLTFSIRISNSQQVMAQIIDDQADVGVTARSPTDRRLHGIKIRVDQLVLLVGTHDRWARRKRVRLAELSDRDIIAREQGSVTRDVAESALKSAGVRTGQIIEVATREAVLEAVAAGFGVGVVFDTESGKDSRLHRLRIHNANVEVAEYAICRADQRAVGMVGRFIDTALRLSNENGWLAEPQA